VSFSGYAGPRATTSGGHHAIQQAIVRQFGSSFEPFGALRRRRNELEYPEFPDEAVDASEAGDAATTARSLLNAADKLMSHLDLF